MTDTTLTAILSDPASVAALLGIACAIWIGQILSFATGAAIAAGLFYAEHPGRGTLVVAALILAWLIHSALYPRRDCLRCKGAGKYKTGFLIWTTSKECRSCAGGRVLRLGRKILTPMLGDWRL